MTEATVSGDDRAKLVERALREVGGGVRVEELAYQTKLSELEVIDALYELERAGRAAPSAWTLGTEAKEAAP